MSRSLHSEFGPPAIGGLLRLAWDEHRTHMYDRVIAAGFEDVTQAQFEIFRFPGPDGMRPGEVAELAGLSKQAVNDVLGQLEHNGYLTRGPHPEDGRARIVHLTDRGWELQRLAHETSRELEAAWAQTIGEERFADLRSALEEIVERGLATASSP
jgi:DNA-binding MarR family transcriptional regulator